VPTSSLTDVGRDLNYLMFSYIGRIEIYNLY